MLFEIFHNVSDNINQPVALYFSVGLPTSTMAENITLQNVKDILTESTLILCKNLRPEEGLLPALVVARAITHDHETMIKNKVTNIEKTETLIDILRGSPVTSYVTFVTCLQKEREDLYKQVMDIQKKYCGKIIYLLLFFEGSCRWSQMILNSGVAMGGGGHEGRVSPLTAKKNPKIGKKRGKIGKKRKNRGRKVKNWESSFTLPLLTDRAGYATDIKGQRYIASVCHIISLIEFRKPFTQSKCINCIGIQNNNF